MKKVMLLVSIGVLCACADKKTPAAESETAQKQTVLAKVGEREITAQEFSAYLKHRKLSPRGEEQLDKMLKEYVEREALSDQAKASSKLDDASLVSELREFEKQMILGRYFDQHLRTSVTDQGIAAYYKAHAKDFETRRVRVAHVLVRVPKGTSAPDKEKKKQRIDQALVELEAGKPFEEIARKYSEDRVSANRGGDMGWVREGAIAPKFAEIAFSLKAGAFSKPVETGFGFHIIKQLEAPRADKKPLTAVEGEIRYKLRAQRKKAEMQRLLEASSISIDRSGWTPATPMVTSQRGGTP